MWGDRRGGLAGVDTAAERENQAYLYHTVMSGGKCWRLQCSGSPFLDPHPRISLPAYKLSNAERGHKENRDKDSSGKEAVLGTGSKRDYKLSPKMLLISHPPFLPSAPPLSGTRYFNHSQQGPGETAQWAKALADKPVNLSSVLETHRVEGGI